MTHVELRGENGNEEDVYDDYEEDSLEDAEEVKIATWRDEEGTQVKSTDEEEEEYVQPRQNLFSTLAFPLER